MTTALANAIAMRLANATRNSAPYERTDGLTEKRLTLRGNLSGRNARVAQPLDATPDLHIPCVTQDPGEPAGAQYLAVCTGNADLIATSTHCPPDKCGGHPICRPCYELALREGLVR